MPAMTFAEKQAMLSNISMISAYNNAIGSAHILSAIFIQSKKEWDGLTVAGTDTHLIKGITTTGTKTDAINTYISKVMKLFTNVVGPTGSAWTVQTVCSENELNMAVIRRIATMVIDDNSDLFRMVATKLMGYDAELVEYALTDDTNHLVNYLGWVNGDAAGHVPSEFLTDLVLIMNKIKYKDMRGDIALYAIDLVMNSEVKPTWSQALLDSLVHFYDQACDAG